MTHPGDWLLDALTDGLDATPHERQELREVLEEVAAEELRDHLPYGDDEADGPWHDQAALDAAGAALDESYAAEAARAAEDEEDRAALAGRPNDEVRLARALDRVGRETYTPPAYFRPARAPSGRFGHMCGPVDDLGGCAARYHQPGCATLSVTDAGNGSFDDAESWNAVVRGHRPPPGADVGLATDYGEAVDEWAGLPGAADPDLHARVLALMGEGLAAAPPLPRQLGPAPDVSHLITELGLR